MTQGPISAVTTVAGVIGDPVIHSLSPTLHNAGFAALGLDWTYVAFPVAAGRGGEAIAAMRQLGIRGLSVTMPHKEAVAVAADRRTPTVEALGAANTLLLDDDGAITAHNTDGDGFLSGMAAQLDVRVEGQRIAVIGAGGAARAIVEACARAGAARIDLINRTAEKAEAAARLAGAVGGVAATVGAHDIVVNTTPLGMAAADLLPCPPEMVPEGAVVIDAIYHPVETDWLAQCRAIGRRGINGFPMLLHQAGLQFELWTGRPAPLDAMRAAAPREVLE